jgi:hypothetical protein
MNDFVPSIGSMIQRNPEVPGRSPRSSPRNASLGNSRVNEAWSSSSASRSATVTGVRSAFKSTEIRVWK